MLRNLPARKPPGRPRKKNKCLDRDRPRRSQYAVDSLIKRLVDKHAREETELNHVAKVKLHFMRGGKRYWNIDFEEYEEASVLGVEELARAISYSYQMGHNIVPN
ncbi:uncharacterized protein PITG_13561 [Phytophthora infestans T30-4]|uniref:Uncharacterized protein n=1 Tax=Phytophthora infestans (strain T30-4) TaxID=403677 RepID=D0NM98_PHYIT|nr:uncharacterized protein PITG_13561 [Phytophthora infestans T30-4]EEY60819.1 conserved hypothetical protein [Phytophthora infestans T30-4]|eukprot:XP_002899765.1 conserved hypothetical protein [Phytophthora infestans T30-4]